MHDKLLTFKKDSKLKSSINLMLLQLGSFVLPIVAVPYIVSTVGVEHYGAFVFFQTVMVLLSVVINDGFFQTGVRDIANCRTIRRLKHEYSHIFYARLLLLSCVVLIAVSLLFFDKFNAERILYGYSFLYLVAMVLDFSFLYQGIERTQEYVFINLVGNMCVLILLFVMIRGEADYVYLPVVFAVPRVVIAGCAMYLLYVRLRVLPAVFSMRGIVGKIRDGLSCFVLNVFMVLYTRATTVLLGLIGNHTAVGYYAIADQLVSAYSSIQAKVSTVYHPQIARGFGNSLAEGNAKASENIQLMALMSIAAFMFIQSFAYEILSVFVGGHAQHAQTVLRILAFNIITISVSFILGIQILLSLRRGRDLLIPSILAAAMNMSVGAALIYSFQHIGAAISVAVIEAFMCGALYRKVRRYGVEVLGGRVLRRLGWYAMGVLCVALILRGLLASLGVGHITGVVLMGLLYMMCVAGILQCMNLIDFKNRKVVIEGA